MLDTMIEPIKKDEMLEKVFSFLDDVRESGLVNMFAAPRILQENFPMTKEQAKFAFELWTKTFPRDE